MRAAIALALTLVATGCKQNAPPNNPSSETIYLKLTGEQKIAGIKLKVDAFISVMPRVDASTGSFHFPIEIVGNKGKTYAIGHNGSIHADPAQPIVEGALDRVGTTGFDFWLQANLPRGWKSGNLYFYAALKEIVEAKPTATFTTLTVTQLERQDPRFVTPGLLANLAGPREVAKTANGLEAIFYPDRDEEPLNGPYIEVLWNPLLLFKNHTDQSVKLHEVDSADGKVHHAAMAYDPKESGAQIQLRADDNTYAKAKPLTLVFTIHELRAKHPLVLKVKATPATEAEFNAYYKEYTRLKPPPTR